jgi:hypothetical protein
MFANADGNTYIKDGGIRMKSFLLSLTFLTMASQAMAASRLIHPVTVTVRQTYQDQYSSKNYVYVFKQRSGEVLYFSEYDSLSSIYRVSRSLNYGFEISPEDRQRTASVNLRNRKGVIVATNICTSLSCGFSLPTMVSTFGNSKSTWPILDSYVAEFTLKTGEVIKHNLPLNAN